MRVVSLTCSNTEIVCALGCAEALVGVDDHSDYPHEVVTQLPRVGPDLGIRVEDVAALRPDCVLASLTVPGHEKVVDGLAAAGIPYVAPEPVSLADTYRDIRDIAKLLGVPERGENLVQSMESAMPQRPTPDDPVRILVEWWPKPVIVPGRQSWVTDLIRRVGAHNPWGAEEMKSRPVETAEVIEHDPHAVVISWCGVEVDKYRPQKVLERQGWGTVQAVRNEAVYPVAEAFLGRPGPRLVQGYEQLRRIADAFLQPDSNSESPTKKRV